MIFGIGSAAIFYITTGQCFHDIKSAFADICCSTGSGPNPDNEQEDEEESPCLDERQQLLLLEQGVSRNEKKLYGT